VEVGKTEAENGTGILWRCDNCGCCWLVDPERCLLIMFNILLLCSIANVFS